MPAHQPLDSETLEAFDQAQRDAIRVLGQAVSQLAAGQTEADVVELVRSLAAAAGFTAWFHEPEVRFGGRLDKLYRASSSSRLAEGTLVEIDLGPATDRAYGEVGLALSFGKGEPDPLVAQARELCRATCGFANRWKTVGELFVFANAWAINHRMSLGDSKAVGHVCLNREGMGELGWPLGARAATLMKRNQIQWYNPRRIAGLYAVRPCLVSGDVGLAFEEMIYIDGDLKRVLGRASVDEIGTLPA